MTLRSAVIFISKALGADYGREEVRKVNSRAEKGVRAAEMLWTSEEKRDRRLRIIKRRGGRRTAGSLAVGVDHPSAKCRAKRAGRVKEGECKLISSVEFKIKG